MIFHTTCDSLYFEQFYKRFRNSILEHNPEAKFSLNYVGEKNTEIEDFCQINNILFSTENTTLEDLKIKFENSDIGNILGYYPLCRWKSIPITGENVVVCDVDILSISKIDIEFIDNMLKSYDAVNITRKKPSGGDGGMMLIALSSNIVASVCNMAKSHLDSLEKKIKISQDVNVRDYIYSFDVFELHGKMLDLTKPKYEIKGEWFVYSKGGQGVSSIKKLEKLNRNLKILKEQL